MSAPPPLPPPPEPVRPNLAHACAGLWRLTWRRYAAPGQLLGIGVMIAVLMLLTYATVRRGNDDAFFEWVISFYLLAVVPIIAFVGGGGAIREDMKPGAIDYLLTRPIPRPVFVATRFGSHLLCSQIAFFIVLAALFLVGHVREITGLAAAFPLLLIAQGVTITAFLAFGYLCGAATSRYLVLGIAYAATVEVALGNVPIQLSKVSVLRHVKAILVESFPRVFEDPVAAQGMGWTLLAGLIFVAVWLTAAAVIFSVQEFAGQRPKDA